MSANKKWSFFKKFDIDDVNDPGVVYLRRWYLIRTPWFGIYLHKIMRPDHDRDLHDHPWNFVPIILWGGYDEQLPGEEFRLRTPGSMRLVRATDSHRIDTLINDKPAWTLCLVGRHQRDWGFHTEQGWVQWEDYIYG